MRNERIWVIKAALSKNKAAFPLNFMEWIIVILLAATIFPVLEIAKLIIRWQERRAAKNKTAMV